jgi:peptidoglycan/LPS O-acetylase OafA/YrhL
MTAKPSTGKLVPLEGLRGLAALLVMLGHIVRGLVPPGPGPLDPLNQLHQLVLNGGAAVTVFFVLSGLILSLPFAKDRRPARILTALLKRWPRLLALTTAACLFSWAAIGLSGASYQQAAALTGNWWMASHFNAPLQGHDTSWTAALCDGVFGVFWTGDVRFDSPLWTMRIELLGSYAIYLAAPLLFAARRWGLRLAILGALMLAAGATAPFTYFTDFLVGTLLAMLLAEGKLPVLPAGPAAAMAMAGVYLFCFSAGPVPLLYAPLKALLPASAAAHFVWDISAACLITVLLGSPALRAAFSGGWAVRLGQLSFPLYVLHVPVMLSAGAVCFLHTVAALGLPGAVLLAAATTIAVTLLCAAPLAWLDQHWTALLGRATGILLRRRPAVSAGS